MNPWVLFCSSLLTHICQVPLKSCIILLEFLPRITVNPMMSFLFLNHVISAFLILLSCYKLVCFCGARPGLVLCYPSSQETMHNTIGSRSDHVALPGARITPSRIKYLHAHPPRRRTSKQQKNSHGKTQEQSYIHKIRIAPAPHPPRTRRPASSPAHPLTSSPACPALAPPHHAKHATHPNLPAAGSTKFGVPAKSAFFVNTLRTTEKGKEKP